jgi:RNA polymerase sigma-70 factor, ECF subfamily
MIEAEELFARERAPLVRHAYHMLGTMTDAEDIVQDAFVRWHRAKRDHVRDPHAFLRATVTNLALDRLRAQKRSREEYVGPWLPEPIIVDESVAPEHIVTVAEDVSFAFLLALERLSPLERAAFLLHDALDVPFAEVAQALGRSEPAVRKLAERGREHVRDAGRHSRRDPNELARVRDAFLEAFQNDDPAAVARLLTEDVVFMSDGGGKVPAATAPVVGRENVTKLLFGIKQIGWRSVVRIELVTLNGMPGLVTFNAAGIQDVATFEFADGRIAAMYVVRNPEKLRAVAQRFQ